MKKKIVKTVVIVLIFIIGLGQIPIPHSVSIKETAIEYSLTDESVAIPHEVIIEGTYYTRLLAKDRFHGKLYMSDVGGLEEDMTADFWFNPRNRYHPTFIKNTGEPTKTAVGVLFFSRNFETMAIQLAHTYEEREDGRSITFGDKQSNFIVLGADTYDEALEAYNAQLTKETR